jgi:DNA-binding transcriptional LysR family regulator
MIPTPIELKYFVEVYHTKHVTRAALRLAVTQPTLTQSIKSLESKMGALLFHRTKQGVVPTKVAIQFYAQILKLHDCWESIRNDLSAGTLQLDGVFTVGCHQSVAAYVAPPLLRSIDRDCPSISIRFVHDFSRKITEKIVGYELDMGFVVNPFKHPDLVFKKIGDDKVRFWKRKSSSKLPKRIFADGQREQIEQLLGSTHKKYFHDWKIIDSSSLEVVRTLTEEGLGIGVIPERVAAPNQYKLEVYNAQLPIRSDEIYLVYRKEVMASRAAKELLRVASAPLK